MGVTLEIWRARIGHFACSRFKTKSVNGSNFDTFSLLMLIAAASVTISILLIGGIEPNPGPFPCKMCSVVPQTIASSMRHQHLHAARNKSFVYQCPSVGCERFATTSFGFLKYHVSTLHRDTFHQDPSVTEKIFCPYNTNDIECSFSSVSFWEFVQHLYCHLDEGTKVMCPVDDCDRTKDFAKKSTLQVHLSQHHPDWRAEGCPKQEFIREVPAQTEESATIPAREIDFLSYEEFQTDNNCDTNDVDHDLLNDDLILDSIGKFYLHLYAENLLPETTIQEICDSLVFLTEVNQARIKLILSSELKECDIPQDKINLICYKVMMADLLYTSHHKSVPGSSFTSDHLRRNYFSTNFGFKEPVRLNLNEDEPDSNDTLEYIDIDRSLTKLLEDPSIEQEIEASFFRQPSENENEVRDYYDGSLFQSEEHPPKEIHLNLYQDSYNPALNALGSAKNKYKDLVVYFTIANFRPFLRSRIATKHLVLICRESIFKRVGAKKCLAEMMLQLKKLEAEGIMFKGERVDVVVEFMIGDSLGQHLIGGFIQNFSLTFFCRFCEIKRLDFKSDPTLTKPQRTKEEYNRCVLRAALVGKTVKGVKEGSELNSLKVLHATSHLVPCLAHDLWEGVASWDLAGVIEYFVHTKKWFTYKLLNDRITSFKCQGIDRSNKPAHVRKKGERLGGHAVQNWMLVRLLLFIIGDKIQDFHDPGWELYLKLKELCEIFSAPSFLKTDIPYIKDVLIPAYFDQRAEVLSENKYPLKPKHHFMAHYPELMLRYGPLIHLWTLPFEQKHSFFKELMRKTRNFINPEHTCAVRYQMSFCYSRTSELFNVPFVEQKSKLLSPGIYTGDLGAYLSRHYSDQWFESESVSVGTTSYKKGDILLLASNNSVLQIGEIKVIASRENSLHFVTEERKAVYDQDLGVYEIQDSPGTCSTQESNTMKYPVPQPLYIWKGRSLISLKFKLIESDNSEDSQ